ncbi:MAG: hypothetical protein HRU20_22720 [Pseudomonadales bacterium]|nr:hypothetical protein [Pseudomonadales bacterium]
MYYQEFVNAAVKPGLVVAKPIIIEKRQLDTAIDTDLSSLSSFKLLSVLRLHFVKGCELENDFIERLKTELIQRGDSQMWQAPH